MFPGELSGALQNVQQYPCPYSIPALCHLSSCANPKCLQPLPYVPWDQHCLSHTKITAARGVPALSSDRKTNIYHSSQTLAL